MEKLNEVLKMFKDRGVDIKGKVRCEMPEYEITGDLLGLDFNIYEGHSAIIDTGGVLLIRVHPSRVFPIH